jgi:hypothetical protein
MDYKLGKLAAKDDKRNVKLTKILKKLPLFPNEWIVDSIRPITIPLPMFANDQFGDCVIAGRGHQTYRFEVFEQDKLINITDDDILKEYWKESGGVGEKYDHGLVMLDSVKAWRKYGWTVNGNEYFIYAFAQVNQLDIEEVKACIYLLYGGYCGLNLPVSAKEQFSQNKIWDVVSENAAPGSWGGHCVYVVAYDEEGLTCVTWGKKQKMTWNFFKKYCDEIYGVIDAKDKWLGDKSPLDIPKLEKYLSEITGEIPDADKGWFLCRWIKKIRR